ncbi:hypothetical protein DYQ05_07815 [Treponema pedis]|nr:hypothetical protein DYQ05_07815 [Treponema pedis]
MNKYWKSGCSKAINFYIQQYLYMCKKKLVILVKKIQAEQNRQEYGLGLNLKMRGIVFLINYFFYYLFSF